jgi:UDPglucose--hexose-1-phosphate uridylyltransferase
MIKILKVNPDYTSTYVFTNDFPALLEDIPEPDKSTEDESELFQVKAAKGTCKVMCFHPQSDISLPLMSTFEITKIIEE